MMRDLKGNCLSRCGSHAWAAQGRPATEIFYPAKGCYRTSVFPIARLPDAFAIRSYDQAGFFANFL
ncbi:MAG: hypothetical protein BAA03_07285 [Caldibacillus debilis]|nr:MAG: hypothetical protein BAA03_07285 [Caldibacillus debilis]